MAKPPHLFIDNSIYFITCRTKDGLRFFNNDNKKDLIKRSISRACNKYNYEIFAWVVLDNHYHLLVKIKNSKSLSKFMQYINGASSRWLGQLDKMEDGLRRTDLWRTDYQSVRVRQTDSLPSTHFRPSLHINGVSSRWLGQLDKAEDELLVPARLADGLLAPATEDGLSVHPDYWQTDNPPSAHSGSKSAIWQNYWDRCIRNEKDFWTHFNYIHNNPIKHSYVTLIKDYKFSSYRHYLKTKGQEWLDSAFVYYPIIDFYAQQPR